MRVFYTNCHQFLFPFILSSSTLIRLSLTNTPKLFLTRSFLPIKSNGHFQSSSDLTQSPVFATVHYSFLEILSSLAFQDSLLAVLSQPPFLAPPLLSSLSMLENSRICPRNASLLYLHLDSFHDRKETHSFKYLVTSKFLTSCLDFSLQLESRASSCPFNISILKSNRHHKFNKPKLKVPIFFPKPAFPSEIS